MYSLQKNQEIASYTVAFPIKQGTYAETYRVKDPCGKNCFLKLIAYNKLHPTQFDENGDCLELKVSEQLNHPNVLHYRDSGEMLVDGKRMLYVVYDFISGETAAQKTTRDNDCTVFDAKQIVLGVLDGLKYLHSLPNPIIHNELTTQNVMLDMSKGMAKPIIIDFGYARFMSQDHRSFQKDGLDLFCQAPEAFNGLFSPQSDIFSVGAMLYQLLFGLPPYYTNLSKLKGDRLAMVETINNERKRPLRILDREKSGLDEQLINIMAKALAYNPDDRFQSADEFAKALKGEIKVSPIATSHPIDKEESSKGSNVNIPQGNGFADVAGMQELKDLITRDIIRIIKDPEKSKRYGLSLPNGMLLYGPPRCGKTFFAKKMAEEVGFNFMQKTPADLKSKWVNASQENIANMFKEAEENAPTIIFIDEINELLPNRSSDSHEMSKSAVNEMLAQMDRTGEKGVFVIGATNYPNMIDPAMLGSGRLEKKFYIGPPDKNARKALFELALRDRYTDFGIDYDLLAEKTDNYVSADMNFIVDEAARIAFEKDEKITMDLLLQTISKNKPSIPFEELKKFESIRNEIEQTDQTITQRKPIGFKR
ncbi:MAG: AAA family ATPase [Bacteroidales bacterium]|nr:AAA family ATPase [Bacteroidales bacterium]